MHLTAGLDNLEELLLNNNIDCRSPKRVVKKRLDARRDIGKAGTVPNICR